MISPELQAAHKRWSALYQAVLDAVDMLASEEDTCDGSREKALAHLAPFFAQGVHSGTVERTGHVAENHGTNVTRLSRNELIEAYRRALARLAEADRFMEIEFGQRYTLAPHDLRLALIRDILRGENGS